MLIAWPRVPEEPKEPAYQGKLLREWLKIYAAAGTRDSMADQRDAARHAVLTIGSNAVPTLLYWLKDNPNLWMEAAREGTDILAKKVTHSSQPSPLEQMSVQRSLAIRGFGIIGTNVPWTLPALSNGLLTARNGHARTYAYCLRGLGTNALPCLFAALRRPGMEERDGIAGAIKDVLRTCPDGAAAWLPIFAPLVEDQDDYVAFQAIVCLGRSGKGFAFTLPTLTNAVSDHRVEVRRCAVMALGFLGSEARPAIGLLQACGHDADEEVRVESTNSLAKIAPELLGNGAAHE